MTRRVPTALIWVAPVALIGATVVYLRSRPPSVEVATPIRRRVVSSIAASGRLRGEIETSVGAQTGGRVAAVPVREGDRVLRGQVVARLDDEVLRAQAGQAQVAVEIAGTQALQARNAIHTAQAQQAQAGDTLTTARAQLTLASRPPLPSDIARLEAETRQAVAVAQARLAGARQKLAELREGPTREERDQATAQANQARATLEQAQRDLGRQRGLLAEGAVAQATVDAAATAAVVAQRSLESAQARLRQLTIGTRPELIAQAEAEVRAATATVEGAQASGAAQLRSLKATPRPEDILVARKKVEEARRGQEIAGDRVTEARMAAGVADARRVEALRALTVARRRVDDTIVRAPFDGTITQIVTEAGGVTGPNAPIVRLVRTGRPEIRIDLDEINLGKIRVGQEALVTSDAFPDQQFKARIRQIGAQVDTDRGTVEVRITPLDPPSWLRPGQTLSVNIVTDPGTDRLVVPLTAINTVGGASTLLAVENGIVVRRDVKIGAAGPDGVPVLEGVRESDRVLVNPAGRTVGEKVAARPATGKP